MLVNTPNNADSSSDLTPISSVLKEKFRDVKSESPFLNDTTFNTTLTRNAIFGIVWGGAVDADRTPIENGNGRTLVEVNDAKTNNNRWKVCDSSNS